MDGIREKIYESYEDIQLNSNLIKHIRVCGISDIKEFEEFINRMEKELNIKIEIIEGEVDLFLKIRNYRKAFVSKSNFGKSDLGL